MTFATITPSRGDRPELLEFCKYQLSRMEVKPDKSYFVDYKPESERIDLVERVRYGVEQAKADGIDIVFIVEDDDFYPADYFKHFNRLDFTFWGSETTTYYNLKSRTYSYFQHQGRSSLFTSGFRISALDSFRWTAPKNRFLDISLWEYAMTCGNPQFVATQAVGIKHNIGLCAGKGHTMRGKNEDESLEWLKRYVDAEAFEFYSGLMKKL
jgi:hypothetical protein